MTTPDRTLEQKIQDDLAAIRHAIAAGQIEEAKTKIGGMSLNVEPGTMLSKEVGDLWWEFGFPAMAGRYWYLLEDESVNRWRPLAANSSVPLATARS